MRCDCCLWNAALVITFTEVCLHRSKMNSFPSDANVLRVLEERPRAQGGVQVRKQLLTDNKNTKP